MNILNKLLLSYKGKIGRADYIYGIVYGYLLIFVCLDAMIQPRNWKLIGSGYDIGFIAQYIASVIGILLAVWIVLAVLIKRARTLGYSDSKGILAFFIPPLVLIGLKKDTEVFVYNGVMSIADRVFFY